MLETLYATGCRASEVVGLRLRDLYLDAGFCKCTGKGSKQRVVPLGKPAIAALRAYLEGGRSTAPGGEGEEFVFVSRTGRPLTRIDLWSLVKKHCLRAGLSTTVSPHTLRHSSRPTCYRRADPKNGAGTAGPFLHPHDTTLHARGSETAQGTAPEVPPAGMRDEKTPAECRGLSLNGGWINTRTNRD